MLYRRPELRRLGWIVFAACGLAPAVLLAGGGPFHTLVVVNTNSAESVELGNYYADAHGIPAHHICRLGLTTNLTTVNTNEFKSLLLAPVTNHIATNGLSGRIDFLVLAWDFPTRVSGTGSATGSLSGAFLYNFKTSPPTGCNLPGNTYNYYYRAEHAYRSADAWNITNGFIAFHLVASNLPTAKLVTDRGAAAQSSFPASAIYLCMLGSKYRNVREALHAHAQFSFTALPGLPATCVTNPWYTHMSGKTNVIGYQDGYSKIDVIERTSNVWLPGTYADHFTSFGGRIAGFTNASNQSTVLDWMGIGATASYGTVVEPCNYLAKFPDSLMALYHARGFCLGESYAMAVAAPYQGLFAGDPLAAPFAAPPTLTVTSPVPYQIVTGLVPAQVSAIARSNGVPAAACDLYVDGRFHTNLASLGPTASNIVSVAIGSCTTAVAVATNPSLYTVVAALADAVNADTGQVVFATAHGDRLELIYEKFDHAGDYVPVSASAATGTASGLTLGVGLAATNLTPSPYPARKKFWLYTWTTNGANAGDTITNIITLTNGVAVTNVIVAAQGEQVTNLLRRVRNAINTNPALTAASGVFSELLVIDVANIGNDCTIFARTNGPGGYGIQVDYIVSAVSNTTGLVTNYNFSSFLDDNPDDIRPRANILFHVRPTNGILAAAASLDTTILDDGAHTLDFVARDGSAVAAESRLTVPIVVCNSSAQLAVLGTNGVAVTNNEPATLAKGTDFGAVEWNQVRTNVFAIHNNGSAALAITNCATNGAGAAAFQVLDLPATVAAGGVSNFAVAFTPPTAGVFQAALSFGSDAIVPYTNLLLAGTGDPHSQTIDFPPIGNQVATNTLGLAATATSGLAVEFTVASGPGQIAGDTNLSFTGSGTVAIAATQNGDANWLPAPPVTNSFQVAKAAAAVTLHDLHQPYDGTARPVTATTFPTGLTVDLTYDGVPAAPTNIGTYSVTGLVDEALYQGADTGTLAVTEAIAALAASGSAAAVTFGPVAEEETYELLFRASLTNGSWTSVTSLVAESNGPAAVLTHAAATNACGYYRIAGLAGPSARIWGYAALAKPGSPELNLVGISFLTSNQTLNSLMDPLQFSGHHNNAGLADQLMMWNPAATAYVNLALFDRRAFGEQYAYLTGWKAADGFGPEAPYTNPVLAAGSAVWIRGSTTNDRQVAISGEVMRSGSVTNNMVAGLQLVANPFSERTSLSNLALRIYATGHHNNAGLADQVMAWDVGSQAYTNLALYDRRAFGEEYEYLTGWKSADGFGPEAPYVSPLLPPGRGFWFRAVNGAFEWTEANPYLNDLE